MLAKTLKTWNRQKGRYSSDSNPNPRTKPGALWERLEDYTCTASGCGCRCTIYRVSGGLVLFRKSDVSDAADGHNIVAHNSRPVGRKANVFSLTVAQQAVALEHAGKMKPLLIVDKILDDTNISSTRMQRQKKKQFATTVGSYLNRETTKKKYLQVRLKLIYWNLVELFNNQSNTHVPVHLAEDTYDHKRIG